MWLHQKTGCFLCVQEPGMDEERNAKNSNLTFQASNTPIAPTWYIGSHFMGWCKIEPLLTTTVICRAMKPHHKKTAQSACHLNSTKVLGWTKPCTTLINQKHISTKCSKYQSTGCLNSKQNKPPIIGAHCKAPPGMLFQENASKHLLSIGSSSQSNLFGCMHFHIKLSKAALYSMESMSIFLFQ